MRKDSKANVLTFNPFQNLDIDPDALKRDEGVAASTPPDSSFARKSAPQESFSPVHAPQNPSHPEEDADEDFLLDDSLLPWVAQHASQEQQRIHTEAVELMRANRWEDILALFHPVETKVPELADTGMDLELRLKVSFALGQLERYDEAIQCLQPTLEAHSHEFIVHSSIAYSAYMSLYAAQNRRILMTPAMKQERIALAHRHFELCRQIRPESVTSHYREAMLYKQVERKTRKATPLFQRAISLWENLEPKEKEKRHQERHKYIRSLYHLASCLLDNGSPGAAHQSLSRCMEEDSGKETLSLLFKHFAMGKILHAMGRSGEALQHLETALAVAEKGQATDFVHELSARCALALKQPEKAFSHISRIPREKRRPYVHWTESDVLWALGRTREAMAVLNKSLERDRRSRHKSLLRLAQLHYRENDVERALALAQEANRFRMETYGNEHDEALFWIAGCLYKLGRYRDSLNTLARLRQINPRHSMAVKLERKVRGAVHSDPS